MDLSSVNPPKQGSKPVGLVGGLVLGGAIAVASGVWFGWQAQQPPLAEVSEKTPSSNATVVDGKDASSVSTHASTSNSPQEGTLLGHFPYEQAPAEELIPIVVDGDIKLRKAAAEAFQAMQEAAGLEGVYLIPISGFRNLEDQQYLFFEIKAERGQVATKRAEVSAPPGYSEHHTGYAVDIGDETVPATNLSVNFENTPAFQWLEANAAHFNFEISFPKNNLQGVSYEPWHWRFVGDRHSLETFYKARSEK